jgi:hypothetical protein
MNGVRQFNLDQGYDPIAEHFGSKWRGLIDFFILWKEKSSCIVLSIDLFLISQGNFAPPVEGLIVVSSLVIYTIQVNLVNSPVSPWKKGGGGSIHLELFTQLTAKTGHFWGIDKDTWLGRNHKCWLDVSEILQGYPSVKGWLDFIVVRTGRSRESWIESLFEYSYFT